MKKVVITALAVMMAAMIACKNEEPGASSLPLDEGPIKYARVTVSAYKEEGLKSWGANIVVITNGKQGAYVYDGKNFHHQDGLKIKKYGVSVLTRGSNGST